MKLQIDRETDALYCRLDDSEIAGSEGVQPGGILDFNVRSQMVGIAMLHVSKRVDARKPAVTTIRDRIRGQEAINRYIGGIRCT